MSRLLAIREAVFRYQFDHSTSAARSDVDDYFLSVGSGHDPSPELLSRFEDHIPEVLPVSASVASARQGVSHADDGGRGLIFNVETIRWLGDDVVEVHGGYFRGGLSASGNTYRVEMRDGVWEVTSARLNWIAWGEMAGRCRRTAHGGATGGRAFG